MGTLPLQGYLAHKKTPPLGPYRRPVPRVLEDPRGVGVFRMGEVPLYIKRWGLDRLTHKHGGGVAVLSAFQTSNYECIRFTNR